MAQATDPKNALWNGAEPSPIELWQPRHCKRTDAFKRPCIGSTEPPQSLAKAANAERKAGIPSVNASKPRPATPPRRAMAFPNTCA